MADTKVSGLVAAASLLGTHEFPVNEGGVSKKVTGAQIMAKLAQGLMPSGLVELTANSAGWTNVLVDLLTLPAITVATGRRVKLSAVGVVTGTINTDMASLTLQEGATVLQTAYVPLAPNWGYCWFCFHVYMLPTAAAHTYKLSAIRAQGTGTMNILASASMRCQLTLEDAGGN